MNFIIIASTLIFMIIIQIAIRRNTKIEKKRDEDFWEREHDANFVRKKSIEHLDYIIIPESILSISPANTNIDIQTDLDELAELSKKKILNLTGLTNTDLKLAYGAANLEALTEYDDNYNIMIKSLQNLAENLVITGDKPSAITVLEFAIKSGSDISKSFFLLADLYCDIGAEENIDKLVQYAENTHSLMRDSILSTLNQKKIVNSQ